MMMIRLAVGFAAACAGMSAAGADVTYTKDIAPILRERCSECHGVDSPDLETFKKNERKYTDEKTGPRMSSYAEVIQFVGWPDTGALMRRLDDGTNTADGRPGNMHRRLGSSDAERAKNLALIKAWVGEGGWNLNRWTARGNVPAITKEQLDKLQLKY